jgi:predicted phosphoribosyltransferase
MSFLDRTDAGRVLSQKLLHYKDRSDVLVLALPRGGVPVAYEVAQALNAPLDVFVVRKLGVPGHEELAMGAIGTGHAIFINEDVVGPLGIHQDVIQQVTIREKQELAKREKLYRGNRPPLTIGGRTVILVDDGLATGASMFAAIASLKQQEPVRIVVAVPVAPPEALLRVEEQVDEVVCPLAPQGFQAVGMWYRNFAQVTDDEVRNLLGIS